MALVLTDMNLTQILSSACVKAPVKSKDKESVIRELVDLLESNPDLSGCEKKPLLDAVMAREQTRSTGIGSGIAIPHGKCKAVKKLVMSLGIAHEPIDFASIDEKPVKIIILLVSPTDQTGPHIQALAKISKLMLDEEFKSQLENAKSSEEAYELISNKESK
ncbi:MAG: PTS sugar transporter subunit IIA [Planctomycetota bacterium]|jgi:fructose-specific phosphotransferase system IIA component